MLLALKSTLTTHPGWSSVFMLSWRLHMFMVFIVHFPSLWLLSWHPSGIQTLQILLAVKSVNIALLGLQNIKCAVWQQMLHGSSAPVISESRRRPGETHIRQSTNIQKTFLHLNLCYALGFFASESKFCIIYSCTVADTLRGDKGIRTHPVSFAEQVCIKCSCLADQPSQAVELDELTNILFCSNNTGPVIVGAFQLTCCAVKAGKWVRA